MRRIFNVFGRLIAIERTNDAWTAHLLGADGKRRPAGLAVPAELPGDELAQYLYDIYHEQATPTNGDVFEIRKE
jgi:hypothetical protein